MEMHHIGVPLGHCSDADLNSLGPGSGKEEHALWGCLLRDDAGDAPGRTVAVAGPIEDQWTFHEFHRHTDSSAGRGVDPTADSGS